MSSRHFYETNSASTPIRSGPLSLSAPSASTINTTSLQKNVNEANKYSNPSSEHSRYSRYEMRSRHRNGSGTPDEKKTTRRNVTIRKRKQIVKRKIETSSEDEKHWQTMKECDDSLKTQELKTTRNSVEFEKNNEKVPQRVVKENESTVGHNFDENNDVMYPWENQERPCEVVRDQLTVVDDLKSIFDEPLPRVPDPSSQKKKDIESDDEDPQIIVLDDEIACNYDVGTHHKTYSVTSKSKNRFHKWKIGSTLWHIRNQQSMMEIRNKPEGNKKKVNRGRRTIRKQRQSPPCKMTTIHRRLGGCRTTVYDLVSSSDEIHPSQWDSDEGDYIPRLPSPIKSIHCETDTYDNKKNELFDDLYRQYKESLAQENYKSAKVNRSTDYTSEQKFFHSRKTVDQHRKSAAKKNNVKMSQTQRTSGKSDDIPKLLPSSGLTKTLPIVEITNDVIAGSSENNFTKQSYRKRRRANNFDQFALRSAAGDFIEKSLSNYEPEKIDSKNLIQKKESECYNVYGSQSSSIVQIVNDITDDSSENNIAKQPYRRRTRRRRRANNFDQLALQSSAKEFVELSICNVDHEEIVSENLIQEENSECYEVRESKTLPIDEINNHFTADSLQNNFFEQSHRKRKKANNFDELALRSATTDFIEKSTSNCDSKDLIRKKKEKKFYKVRRSRSAAINEKISQKTALPSQAVDAELVEHHREKVSPEMHEIEISCSSFSEVEEKILNSSDENTGGDSEETLIVDHNGDLLSARVNEIMDTIQEESDQDESFKYRKKRCRVISSSSSDGSEPKNSLFLTPRKPKIRSIEVPPKGFIRKCGFGQWQIDKPKSH